MPYELPLLPYSLDALEPYFDMATMRLHHDKHHQTYLDKLNAALVDHPEQNSQPIETLLANLNTLDPQIQTVVRNHGGGHHNHSLFWTSLTPQAPSEPSGTLHTAINQAFSSFSAFKDQFTNTAASHFGSGWAWLSLDSAHKLKIYSLPNQDSPLSQGDVPLLGLDVWEHAYYLKYQNRRPEYIEAWWHLINWPEIEKRYQSTNT